MPIFPSSLAQQLLTTDWADVYASPQLGRTIVKSIYLCNVAVVDTAVDIALLRSGETVPVNKNMLYTALPIGALQSVVIGDVIVLEQGDKIVAKATNLTSILMSGALVSDISYFSRHNDLMQIQGDGPDLYHMSEDQYQAMKHADNPSGVNPFVTVTMLAENAWKIVTSDYQSVNGDRLFVDVSGGSVTISMPQNPTIGQSVGIVDVAGMFDAFPLVLARNGNKIMGLDEDMIVSTPNEKLVMTFSNDLYGWRLTQ